MVKCNILSKRMTVPFGTGRDFHKATSFGFGLIDDVVVALEAFILALGIALPCPLYGVLHDFDFVANTK